MASSIERALNCKVPLLWRCPARAVPRLWRSCDRGAPRLETPCSCRIRSPECTFPTSASLTHYGRIPSDDNALPALRGRHCHGTGFGGTEADVLKLSRKVHAQCQAQDSGRCEC